MAGILKKNAWKRVPFIVLMIGVILWLAFPANSNAQQLQDADVADLTLIVQPYVSVTFDDDVTMTDITAAMFAGGYGASTGQVGMSFAANTGAIVHVPMETTLTRLGAGVQPTIDVDLDITMSGWVTSPTPVMIGSYWFWEATLAPGVYTSGIFQAEISPPQPIQPGTLWAGTYQGTAYVTISVL